MLLSKILKIVRIEIVIIMMWCIVVSSCNIDLKTEVISEESWFYPVVKTGRKETKSVCDAIKTSQSESSCKKGKRNLISNINKHFKRKHNCAQETTCTLFFIPRSTNKRQVLSFNYPIPPTNQESSFTEAGFPIDSLETKRGKLRNFFFPKLSSIPAGQQLEFDSNISTNETTETVTVGGWENKEDSNFNLSTDTNSNNNQTRDNFQQSAKKIAPIHKTEIYTVSTQMLAAEGILPSMTFDLGLCSGEPKDLMKETTSQRSMTNLSLPFSKPDSKHRSENPVTTVNFLQNLKLKVLTFNSAKQNTDRRYLNSTANNLTKVNSSNEEEGSVSFTQKLSPSPTEILPDSATGTTDSTSFYPYTKFQVKDLFNFNDRPTAELYNTKSNYFTKTKTTLESLTSSSVSSNASTKSIFDNNVGKSVRSKETTTQSEEIVNNTPCECSLDYDASLNTPTNNDRVEMNLPESGAVESLSPETETVTSRSFVNLKNIFGRKKPNIVSHLDSKTLTSYTERLNLSSQNTNHIQSFENVASSDEQDDKCDASTQQKDSLLDNLSSKKLSTLTTLITGSHPISFNDISNSVYSGKKPPTETPLPWTKHELNISSTSQREFFNLKRVLHLKRKNNSELSPNFKYNASSEEEYSWTESQSSATVNVFESQVRSSANANESLVDMNPDQFYKEFEKSTKTILDKLLVRKQKLDLKHMFSFTKQTSTSNKIDQSPNVSDQNNAQDSFQVTDVITLNSLNNSKSEKVEEDNLENKSTRRSTNVNLRFRFKPALTTLRAFKGMPLEYSEEPRQRSGSRRLSHGRTVPTALLGTEEGIAVTVDEGKTLDQHTYKYSAVTSLEEDGIAKRMFKLKSGLSLHKPVSSSNTKLCQIFDPGGCWSSPSTTSSSSSDKVTSQERTVQMKVVNSFEQSTNLSLNEYNTTTQQYHSTETVRIEHPTKPVGWWLFWNQPKITFDVTLSSKNGLNGYFGTKVSTLFGWQSTTHPVLKDNIIHPTDYTKTSGLYNTRSTKLMPHHTEINETDNSNLKKIQKYVLGERKSLKTSTPVTFYSSANNLPPASKNKQIHSNKVNISISNFNGPKTKYNRTTPNNSSNKNIHSSISVISLKNKNKINKPFEKVVNATQSLYQRNISGFDAKNLSYFIQNLTRHSNNTLLRAPKPIVLNSNTTMRNYSKPEPHNSTVLSTSNSTTTVNDSSFSIMAYVLRPLESLISVFKGKSTQNMTKVGDVNASDIHNGSIPSHLHPQNSSLVILAVNNTNSTSRETHESKVGLFDVLGGWFHCIVDTYVEPGPRDIHFYLFTRNNIDTPEELLLSEEEVEVGHEDNATDIPTPVWEAQSSSDSARKKRQAEDADNDFEPLSFATSELESKWFNLLAETKILIHGYIQDYQTDIIVNMKDAYLKKGAYNVIVVDWSTVGDNTCYPSVAEHGLSSVGRLFSRLLDQLVAGGVSLARVHVVGFSLGAHVAGIAGTNTRGLLARITGLDPALPYVPMDPEICLDAGDAVFVDIIHSAAGYLGQPGPTGHVDFYPNGGSQQPGCDLASLGACSHRRSALYFIESINSKTSFRATPCDSWHDFQTGRCNSTTTTADLLMGEPCPTNASGKYFLRTGHKEPFAILAEEHSKVKKSLLLDIFYELV